MCVLIVLGGVLFFGAGAVNPSFTDQACAKNETLPARNAANGVVQKEKGQYGYSVHPNHCASCFKGRG
jgi:hypothetical protein